MVTLTAWHVAADCLFNGRAGLHVHHHAWCYHLCLWCFGFCALRGSEQGSVEGLHETCFSFFGLGLFAGWCVDGAAVWGGSWTFALH
jgi:hypothetical protein